VFVKGAPESVLPLCRDRIGDASTDALQPEAVRAQADSMGERGLRVLAFATRTVPALSSTDPGLLESDLTFLVWWRCLIRRARKLPLRSPCAAARASRRS